MKNGGKFQYHTCKKRTRVKIPRTTHKNNVNELKMNNSLQFTSTYRTIYLLSLIVAAEAANSDIIPEQQ